MAVERIHWGDGRCRLTAQDSTFAAREELVPLYVEHNQSQALVTEAIEQVKTITIDMDLTGRPVSENAQGAKKGYFSRKRGIYGRQLARVLVPDTQEIIAEELYPGNRLSCQVFGEMLSEMEQVLSLDTKEKRQRVCLRLDGGFGTDKNINHALWKGYQLLAKMFSGNRAKVLAQSVQQWVDVDGQGTRQAGWVTKPHRYGRKTRQLAVRKPNPKKQSGFNYVVLVITDMTSDMLTLLQSYDARSGVPESTFCQDNQGLAQRKLRKHQFIGQQMLVLLSQLVHNLCQWLKRWMVDALAAKEQMEQYAQQMMASQWTDTQQHAISVEAIRLTIESIQQRGIRRWIRQLFALDGVVIIKKGVVVCLTLNANYPLIDRLLLAFRTLLEPVGVCVRVAKP
ncbi:MAG: transposase [Ignavibacteria bacterium]|nr:transposase [Ignavibacteria bacterium]